MAKNNIKRHKKSKSEIRRTKQQLKTMMKTGRSNPLRNASRITKYGTLGVARNIWLSIAATLVMVVTLVIFYATLAGTAILTETARDLRSKIDISLFFKPETNQEQLKNINKILIKDDNVKTVTISSASQELYRFSKENQDQDKLIKILEDPEMQKIMLSTMYARARVTLKDLDQVSSFKTLVESNPEISSHLDERKLPSYDTNKSQISRISSWTNIAIFGGISVTLIFLVIAIIIIFNTVRMAVYSRREEIYMMKLVGANNAFIKGPFLIEAELSGVISGTIAAVISYFATQQILPWIEGQGINVRLLEFIVSPQLAPIFFISIIALGVIIAAITARLALLRYLRRQ